MKRYAFLTLIFLAMVVAIVLSSCAPAPASASAATSTQGLPTTQAAPLAEKPVVEQPKPTTSPTSVPTQVIPVTAPVQVAATINAEVTADVLNVRIGPGMNHKIMAQLVAEQVVKVEGRSKNSEWAAVFLADGREGWVYSSYLRPSADLASLPVMEAYGGPLTSEPEAPPQPAPKPSGRYRLDVSISYNQAEVRMARFAPNGDVTLRLAVPGEGIGMAVATTTTDAQGSATVIFDMPTSWPDGSAVTQNQLELQVLNSDGKVIGKAKITYQSGL